MQGRDGSAAPLRLCRSTTAPCTSAHVFSKGVDHSPLK
jgi:hypothetical protein